MQISVPFVEANNREYPVPVAIAIAKDSNGKYNPITLGWITITSWSPRMYSIAVSKSNYSMDVIRSAKEFVLAFPSVSMAEEALYFGTCSGRDTEKLTKVNIATQPAKKIDSLIITDAVANFECKLISEHPAGDHIIFVGEVVESYMNADPAVKRLYIIGPGFKLGTVFP